MADIRTLNRSDFMPTSEFLKLLLSLTGLHSKSAATRSSLLLTQKEQDIAQATGTVPSEDTRRNTP